MPPRHVIIIGGGLSGLASAIALAGNGMRVSVIERQPRLGGRATSYVLPGGERIDNCQHVTLGCCTNLEDFYKRTGVAGMVRYHNRLEFADSTGHRAQIKAGRLPAPFHLAPSFAAFRLLGWRDRRVIAYALFQIIRSGGQPRLSAGTTMLDWLKKNGQTPNAIHRFWRVVLVSALNEQLDRTDAAYGIAVLWKAFLANRNGFLMGVPSVPLETLYASAADLVKRANSDVRTRCGAVELCVSNGKAEGIRLDDGSLLKGDYYIAAIPFDRLLKILPADVLNLDTFANVAKLHVSPITSVHLWFDRPIMSEPFLTSVDQTIQWVFNKSAMRAESSQSEQYLQVVISASHQLTGRTQQEIITMCCEELATLLPGAGTAKLVRAIVIRENAATFSPEPGSDQWRPTESTPIRNLLLAGDWTRTGWPATMEGAVRSGYRAAETILALEGKPVQVVQAELPASRLARFLALMKP